MNRREAIESLLVLGAVSRGLRPFLRFAGLATGLSLGATAAFSVAPLPDGAEISMKDCVVVAPGRMNESRQAAVELFQREIERRVGEAPALENRWLPEERHPTILVIAADSVSGLPQEIAAVCPQAPAKAESYALKIAWIGGRPTALVVGRDDRGWLFGLGRLLREMRMDPGRIDVPASLDLSASPTLRWRGHQLGYRPKTNSYDGWDVDEWKTYIGDLAVFGSNAVELVAPHSDDDPLSPHFPRPPLEMMVAMSGIVKHLGLECWVWIPALEKNYGDPATRKKAASEWNLIFRSLPRIDAVFVPGGDPGSTPPEVLMGLLEEEASDLRRTHPNAGMWVSPQGFRPAELKRWLEIVQHKPAWLTGVVYGPWIRMPLAELRQAVPKQYPLRLYPDITHIALCQYPLPHWDPAFASTEGREAINPRPLAMEGILRKTAPYADGFISYSEGCNDDVNKMVWSGLAWDPSTPVRSLVDQYSRYFVGASAADRYSQGLCDLEKNWDGPLSSNAQVARTCEEFRLFERSAPPSLLHNWRFLQALYRAYFDRYLQVRQEREKAAEADALAVLAEAPLTGSVAAMSGAAEALTRSYPPPAETALRTRVFQLAEGLFQTIQMQLSVPLYAAEAVWRGANLDTVDLPLNDRGWILAEFERIGSLKDEGERLNRLAKIVNWKNPGPGGFYDDLSDPANRPHWLAANGLSDDPEYRDVPVYTHTLRDGPGSVESWRSEWWAHLSAYEHSAVTLRYSHLDPRAHYKVKVVYVPSALSGAIHLTASGRYELHPPLDPGVLRPNSMPIPREFEVPSGAYADGELALKWTVEPSLKDLGGFAQISEVWLVME
jgi:hypothetical protein